MAIKLLMRGGIYLLFIAGVVAGWIMKRRGGNDKTLDLPLSKKYLDNTAPENPAEGLKHPSWQIRLLSIQSLIDNPNISTLPALLKLLNDADYDVRLASMNALSQLGSAAVDGLLLILENGSLHSREMAVRALGKIGTEQALDGLADAMSIDESVWVRIPAIEALALTGDERYVPDMIDVLKEKNRDLDPVIREALRRIGTPEALAALDE